MRATERLYRTTEGDLVAEGNPAAAFLAYAEGDEVAAADEAKLKSRKPVVNKMAGKTDDKSVKPAPKARGK
jgi:hypothetical protein